MKIRLESVMFLAAAALLVSGCKKKDDAQQQQQQQTGSGSAQQQGGAQQQQQQQAQANAQGTGDESGPKIEGCNSDFKVKPTANTTLTEKCSPYKVAEVLSVDGWDLTIEPGVELQFQPDARLEAGYDKPGRITAKGTAEKPIKLVSGNRKEPGGWGNVRLHNRGNGSTFEHVVVEHAGGGDTAAIHSETTDVKIKNVKFVGVKAEAFEENHYGGVAEFADNDLSQAGETEMIIQMNWQNVSALKNNKFGPKHAIGVKKSPEKDLTVPNAGVPYRVAENIDIDGASQTESVTMTIQPGAVFEIAPETTWLVGYNAAGHLKAVGTAEAPIIFRGVGDAEAGSWRGISFRYLARSPHLEFVKISNAGGPDGAALSYEDLRTGLGKLKNVTISKSKGHAIKATGDDQPFEVFSDNAFEEIADTTLLLPVNLATKLGPNNKFPENGAIELERECTRDVVLTAQSAPYVANARIHVDGSGEGKPATLTLEAGAVLKFGPEAGINVGFNYPGTFKVAGAADKPVTLTALNDPWKGIDVRYKGKLQIENAVFEKTAEDEPAITVAADAQGGVVKAAKFNEVKTPIRDCSTKKLTVEGVKSTKEGC